MCVKDTVEAKIPNGLLYEVQVFVSVRMNLLQLWYRVRLEQCACACVCVCECVWYGYVCVLCSCSA